MNKYYITPDGNYYEGVYVHIDSVECSQRPSNNHVRTDNWQDDPMDEMVCWRSKDQGELDTEQNLLFDNKWKEDPENDTLILALYEIYLLATGTNPTHEQFWNALKARFRDPSDNFFDF